MSTTVELLAANERYERLRAAVEALAREWTEWSLTRSTPRIDAFRDAAEEIDLLLTGFDA